MNSDGRHVGRFVRNEVYGPHGQYLGEMAKDNRLVARKERLGWRRGAFAPIQREGLINRKSRVPPYAMPLGYQDFVESAVTLVSLPVVSHSLQYERQVCA